MLNARHDSNTRLTVLRKLFLNDIIKPFERIGRTNTASNQFLTNGHETHERTRKKSVNAFIFPCPFVDSVAIISIIIRLKEY